MNPTIVYVSVVGVTFLLVFGAIYLLLGKKSLEKARLREVSRTGFVDAGETPEGIGGEVAGLDADRLEEAIEPIKKFLGPPSDLQLAGRLVMAGYRKPVHVDIFRAFKIILPLVGALAGYLVFRTSASVLFAVVIAAIFGFLLPDFWLGYQLSSRKEKIRLALPDALDLLVICVEAGLGLDQGLHRVGQELKLAHPELSEEFNLISLEQRAGKPRMDAWRHMADRTGVEMVRGFINMLTQTERFGTPISKSLGAFADEVRLRRRQEAEEKAAKTTIKLIFPLVIFIFPSMFIVLIGPAVITLVRNLSKAWGG